MTRAMLITNPVAGRTGSRAVAAIHDTLRDGGWSVEVLTTARPGDARRFAEQGRAQGVDVLVCYGGDGTVMQVAAAAVGSGIPIGLVPGGTGNLLAGNLRLPGSPRAAARAILRGKPRAIDLGAVQRPDGTHYFAVCCGAGFDAWVMAATGTAEKRRWKMAAYAAHALAAIPEVTSPLHRVTVDGTACDLPAAMVLVANCGEIIPRFLRLREDVAPDDGWLDVVAFKASGTWDCVAAFLELLRRSLASGASPPESGDGAGRLWFGRGRTVRVDVLEGPPRPMQIDGEPWGDTPFEAHLLPGAIAVLVEHATAPRRGGRDA